MAQQLTQMNGETGREFAPHDGVFVERTGRQDAVSAFVADDVAHLLHRDVLHENEDGRDLVGEHVCVGRGRQPLARHRYHVHAVAQLIEKTWMTCK